MPDVFRSRAHTKITADQGRAIGRLERRPHSRTIPFTLPGALTVSTSPPWVPQDTVVVSETRVLLGTAGTSSTVVTVYKNGSSVGTVTLTSGQTNVSIALNVSLIQDTDLLTVGVTTVGTGAVNLTVLVRYA